MKIVSSKELAFFHLLDREGVETRTERRRRSGGRTKF
jgi:hypothetical protein